MAYNIIKGRVEFSASPTGSIESLVDIWRNQSIGGVKTFTSTVSASAFWDTAAGGEVRALKSLIGSDGANRVLTSDGDGTLTAESNLTIDAIGNNGQISLSPAGQGCHITGSTFSGSAHGLTGIILNPDHLAATNYDGFPNRLSASNLVLGIGLSSSVHIEPASSGHGPELQVTGGTGIIVDGQGVQVLTASNGGLKFTGQTLQVDAANTTNKGGGPSNNDEFIIADSSDSDSIKNLTYSQIKTAIADSISVPITSYTNNGDNRIITSVNSTTVNAEANLSFDGSKMQLTGGLQVSGSRATKLVATPALSANSMGVAVSAFASTTWLYADLFVSNGTRTSPTNPVLMLSKTGSMYLIDGDDIGQIDFNTRGDASRDGNNAAELSPRSARILVEADGSEHNAESKPGRMSFWTCPTGTINPVQRMTINNSGNVGIGFNSPTSVLYVNGDISSSLGIHVTGSDPHISIGARRGTAPNAIMLNVTPGEGQTEDNPEDHNNKILALFKRSEGTDSRTILAVTGSGKVAIGGAHLDGVLNISGSDTETLISARNDTHNPAFTVGGGGDAFIKGNTINSGSFTSSGSVRAPLLRETIHTYAPADTVASYIRFYETGRNTGFDKKVIMVKPYLGNLDKIIARGTSAAGSTAISFHKAGDGSATPNGSAIETVTVDMSSANTSYTFIFDPATSKFAAGDVVSVKVNPSSDPGDITLTCVWEYDTRTT